MEALALLWSARKTRGVPGRCRDGIRATVSQLSGQRRQKQREKHHNGQVIDAYYVEIYLLRLFHLKSYNDICVILE